MSFTLCGINVRIDFYFAALITAFILLKPDGAALSGFLAAILHECGHLSVMLYKSRARIRSVELTPFGMRITSDGADLLDSWWLICAAGVAANLTVAAILLPFAQNRTAGIFCAANVLTAGINMLPIEPLDGGRLLRTLLEKFLPAKLTERVMLCAALAFILPLTALGLILLMRTKYNYSMLLLGLWLIYCLLREWL